MPMGQKPEHVGEVMLAVAELDEEGETYFKSRDIAERTGLSKKQVANVLTHFKGLVVDVWGNSHSGVTWVLL